ncbi:hypothetical protein GCM10011316_28690 [Roseibium aquae]|uniref:Uncharacterized protein n=1 Tax=Roseibium aquae TaxID=1323746 RepID=A0A916TLB9_9HYPH|nr:hypothetical protein GCM10011316_28690 [Roseibium aquae]
MVVAPAITIRAHSKGVKTVAKLSMVEASRLPTLGPRLAPCRLTEGYGEARCLRQADPGPRSVARFPVPADAAVLEAGLEHRALGGQGPRIDPGPANLA